MLTNCTNEGSQHNTLPISTLRESWGGTSSQGERLSCGGRGTWRGGGERKTALRAALWPHTPRPSARFSPLLTATSPSARLQETSKVVQSLSSRLFRHPTTQEGGLPSQHLLAAPRASADLNGQQDMSVREQVSSSSNRSDLSSARVARFSASTP